MNKMPLLVVHGKIKDPIYERMQGSLKFYSVDRGFGFLKRAGKQDVFVTNKALEKSGIAPNSLKENDIFDFDFMPVEGKPGKAINLKKVSK